MKPRRPGELRQGQIAVVDHNHIMRGRVHGAGATSVTAARFGIGPGARLGRHNGRPAWIGKAPEKSSARRAMRMETKNHAAARGSVKGRQT